MEIETMRLCFMDEAPRVGSGWRRVDVERGWKWTYIKDHYQPSSERTKLATTVFDGIVRVSQQRQTRNAS